LAGLFPRTGEQGRRSLNLLIDVELGAAAIAKIGAATRNEALLLDVSGQQQAGRGLAIGVAMGKAEGQQGQAARRSVNVANRIEAQSMQGGPIVGSRSGAARGLDRLN